MELAATSIRLVKAQQGTSGYEVLRSAEVEFPPNVYHDGQIFDLKAFRTTLREAMRSQLGGVGRRTVVSAGGQVVLIRRVAMPKLKRADLLHLLETQGEQWIPFLREGATFDVVVVNPNVNEYQQEVLLVAIPTRFIEYATAVLSQAGLKLVGVDVDISAVYRAAVMGGNAPTQGAVAVLDLSKEKPRMGLFRDGLIVAARTLESRPARPNGSGDVPALRFGGDFPVEVRRTVELMMTPLPEGTLLGGVVLLDPLKDPVLHADLEREVSMALQDRLAPDFRFKGVLENGLTSSTVQAFGLSLANGGNPVSFNLLPRPTIHESRQRRLSLLLSLLLILGLGGYGYMWNLQMPALQEEQISKQRTLNDMKPELAREKEVALEEQKAKALAPLLDKLDQYDPWSVVEPRLRTLLPPGVRLQTVGGALPSLSVTGTAPNPDRVADLMNALDQSPHFLKPILANSGTNDGEVTFSLTVILAKREVSRP